MLSKKMITVGLLVVVFIINLAVLSLTSRSKTGGNGFDKVAIMIAAPFQDGIARVIRGVSHVWENYFYLVNTSRQNHQLKKELSLARQTMNQYAETELLNVRLKKYLSFKDKINANVLAARVVAKDSSRWYRTILINKGSKDGITPGCPVVVPEGIAGQVITASSDYSKVLLIIDRNCAVDALVQRSRARGIVKGESSDQCRFEYVLRKNDVVKGDTVVSSGLDGIYPKGLRVGKVTGVVSGNAGIFQTVTITPYVAFEKLEEVLVIAEKKKNSETP